MTNEEALRYFEKLRKTFMEHYEREESYWGRHHWMASVMAIDMAISALQDQIARKDLEPSDLIHRDELRCRAEAWAEDTFADEHDNFKYNSLVDLIDESEVVSP